MKKKWNRIPIPQKTASLLQKDLGIHAALCEILAQRKINSYEAAKSFFRPNLNMLHNPYEMKDMQQAISRIEKAIAAKEKILLLGDYDVDGTTSAAMFYSFLKTIYSDLEFYIPNRYKEGYGVSKKAIEFAHHNKISLIITLDCGIKSKNLIDFASELKIDFIICDHHTPPETLPAAVAILNPKQKNCTYPYKDLCGCGVTFKLMQAICQNRKMDDNHFLKYLDFLALAIIADIVPLTGENRIMAYFGLKKIRENPSPGIKALLEVSDAGSTINTYTLAFLLAPRINAAGRMDEGHKAVQLFISGNNEEALPYAQALNQFNAERKNIDAATTQEALEMIHQNAALLHRKTTVVYKEGWHKGVVGIVASRLIENFYRPTVVLTKSEGIIAGSARSVEGFNLYEAIDGCKAHLLGYGGHFAAAGMTLDEKQLPDFIDKFEEVVSETIQPEMLIPQINIDAEIKFSDINFKFCHIIEQMEPFGPENLPPVFLTKGVTETGFAKIIKEKHIRFVFQQENYNFTGIGFNLADKFELLQTKSYFNIIYHLEINEYNHTKSIQLKILDFE